MRITSVELHPDGSSNAAVLSFRNPNRELPYNVRMITGLDADEIVAKYYGVSGSSAKKFYTLEVEKRDPVFRIQLTPRFDQDETYSSLRDDLYRMIASSRTGKLAVHFKNGLDVVAALTGFVTKFETNLFEKDQEVQLTLSADDPMLRALVPTDLVVGPLNPDLTTISDPLSTAPHGFKFALTFVTPKASVKMRDPMDDSWSFEVTPVGGFLAGDVLHFSSEKNDKYLYIQRGANKIHLADKITPGSLWPILFPGDNVFKVDGVAVDINQVRNMNWSAISHRPAYWGV